MITLKTKIVKTDDKNQIVELKKYNHKHSTTGEHIVAITVLMNSIMENDDTMSKTKLMKLIKSSYENQEK